MQILISKVRGTKLGNTIKFPSGLRAPHSDGVVQDTLDRMLIWSTKELPCGDTMSLMYQGRAKLHQAKSNVKASLEEAIVLVEQNETRRYAGLVLEGTSSLCGHVCHNTQVPNMIACLEIEDPNRHWRFLKAFDHEKANLFPNMHFLHLS
jgi:DNA helicase TIP49 (TBP-interacting protein)